MKTKILIVTVSLILWTVIVLVHAKYSIAYGLQHASDGYNTVWGFQAMAFILTKLPFYILGLILCLIIELSLFPLFDKKKN